MKNVYLYVLSIIGLLLMAGMAAAHGAAVHEKAERYLVHSDSGLLKAAYGLHHRFGDGFTADLTSGQAAALQRSGVDVERVDIYHILGKPVCGDGKCSGAETAANCPADCSSEPVPDPAPSRSCYPDSQMPYGIAMVSGGSGGAGVDVVVLDTGVNVNHPDLDVKVCKDTTKRGIRDGCSDTVGHGTHVSGTIAANGGADGKGIFGVAPDANLWMLKVCGNAGCYSDDIAEGIYYAADNGAEIISMSLGGDSESGLIHDAIDYATARGVLIVAAAGNDGPEIGSIDYPGANPKVVAVGAVDSGMHVSSWSSRGINDGDYVVEEREVELAAPGVDVLSAYKDGCYAYMSGTSMATPHVAGLAAKLWQGSADATRAYLHQVAQDIDAPGDDPATGFGLATAS